MTRGRKRRFQALVAVLAVAGALPGGCNPEWPCPSSTVAPADSGSAIPPGDLYAGSGDPYQAGALGVRILSLARCESGAPRPLDIHVPLAEGTYPVVVFQHGYRLFNLAYRELLSHVASHGFVVAAAQMYSLDTAIFTEPGVDEEVRRLTELLDWLPGRLSGLTGVAADTRVLGLAGHSRGGRVAWQLLSQNPSRAIAVAGLDPVDAGNWLLDPEDRITPAGFPFALPSLIIGAGRSGLCAPVGYNHDRFYAASLPPAWHIVIPEGGHMDFVDGRLINVCGLVCTVCDGSPNLDAVRRLSAGLLTAFFRASLQGDDEAYRYLSDPAGAPVSFEVEAR